MKIFFAAPKCIPIHARSLDERPLGGTETGLIRVAAALHERGHEVTVFTSMHSVPPSPAGAPTYLPIDRVATCGPCDVLVAVQDWWPVCYPVQARARMYWTGDASDQYMTYGLGDLRVASKIDRLLMASRWQADELCARSGFPRDKARVVRNGVHLPWFEGDAPRDRWRLIYTSPPYRGLDLALHCFSVLRARLPEVQLHAFAGMAMYDRETPFSGPHMAALERTRAACAAMPGVVLHPNVTQIELAREYRRSRLFFYPAMIPETFCITAMEAQAAGCPALTSALGGLPDTVGDGGVTVSEPPGTPAFIAAFVGAAHAILTDEALWERLSRRGAERAREAHAWSHVADRLEAAFAETL